MKVSLKDPRIGAMVFVAVFAVFIAANFGLSSEPVVVSAAVMTPFPADAAGGRPYCDIDCCSGNEGTCGCDAGTHDAWDTVPNFYFWTRNGGVHQYPGDCREYECDVRHGPYCPYPGGEPLTSDYLEQLRTAVVATNANLLARLIIERPEIKVNLQRSALQIENCKGRTVMHLPLPKALAQAVHSALPSTSH